jgi:hypothetical protein
MAIPARLRLPPVDQRLFDEMSMLCDSIEAELGAGDAATLLLRRWNAHTWREHEPHEFQNYWRSIDKETFVRNALNPEPRLDDDLRYSEALAVLEAVTNVAVSVSEIDYYLSWLEAQLPGGKINDLIYWPDEWFGDASLFADANGAFKPEAKLSNDQILAGQRLTRQSPDPPVARVSPPQARC